MKPNERRTADGRQPRPSCQLIDRNTSINGPRARMHAIPFLGFFVFGTSRVSSRWPQVALVEKKPTVGDVVWKFWNCSWLKRRIELFDGNVWNFVRDIVRGCWLFDSVCVCVYMCLWILFGGIGSLAVRTENLEVRLDAQIVYLPLEIKRDRVWWITIWEKCLLSKVNHCSKSTRSSILDSFVLLMRLAVCLRPEA